MVIWFLIIFVVSFLLAIKSMSDFVVPEEIKNIINRQKIKGTIIFLKGKIKHYYLKK